MALITVTQHKIKIWQQNGAFELRVYAAESFYNSSGILVPASTPGDRLAYLKAACTYDPVQKVLTIPPVVIDSTTDALSGAQPKYAFAGIYKLGTGECIYTILDNFSVPHDFGAGLTWLAIQISNHSQLAPRIPDKGFYNKPQIDALFAQFLIVAAANAPPPTVSQIISSEFDMTLTGADSGNVFVNSEESGNTTVFTLPFYAENLRFKFISKSSNVVIQPAIGGIIQFGETQADFNQSLRSVTAGCVMELIALGGRWFVASQIGEWEFI